MNRPIMDTDNFVAFIQLPDGSTMAGCILGPTVDDVEDIIRKMYSDIEWQFRPDTVCIYKVVREANGYIHTGDLVSKYESTHYMK